VETDEAKNNDNWKLYAIKGEHKGKFSSEIFDEAMAEGKRKKEREGAVNLMSTQ